MQRNNKGESLLSFDVIGLIIYIVVFLLLTLTQMNLDAPGVDSVAATIIRGISTNLMLLLSVFVVVAVPKFGYLIGVILNVLSAVRLVISICFLQQMVAINGLISTLATIILISIIHFFYKKITKSNADLIQANYELREKDEKLSYLAYYDILTGLPNRQLFIERIDEAINQKNNAPFTIISANIDNFKNINNTYGNNAGDAALCSYSKKLKRFCGDTIFLARINGDEFGLILYGNETETSIISFLDSIKELISEPVLYQDKKIFVTMSYAVAAYPANANNSTEILKCINSAMTVSKASGRSTHCFYSHIRPQASQNI